MTDPPEPTLPPWRYAPPGRIIGRGHPAGDFLEAYDWQVLETGASYLKLDVHLPPHLKNPRGQLFGGFTPAYVDLVALRTVAQSRPPGDPPKWLATVKLAVDYLEPIVKDRFLLECEIVHHRKGTHLVQVRFRDHDGPMLAFAVVTLREVLR